MKGRGTSARVLIIFNELLKGRKLSVDDMVELCLRKNYPVDRYDSQRDIRVIFEEIDIVEREKSGSRYIYYIPSGLRRLNYF